MTSISIRPAEQPITEDDAFIRRAVSSASTPALMMSLVHASGDRSLLDGAIRPRTTTWASAGLLARNRQQLDLQESHLRRAIALNPNYAPARQWLSQYLVDIGRFNEALVEAERAVEIDPFSSKLNEVFGSCWSARETFRRRKSTSRKAVAVDPTFPGSYAELGRMKAYVQNRFVDAVPLARRAAELDPGNPALVADLFGLYMDLGDYGQADREVRVLLDRWPSDWRTLGSAAYVKMIRGEMEGATRDARGCS